MSSKAENQEQPTPKPLDTGGRQFFGSAPNFVRRGAARGAIGTVVGGIDNVRLVFYMDAMRGDAIVQAAAEVQRISGLGTVGTPRSQQAVVAPDGQEYVDPFLFETGHFESRAEYEELSRTAKIKSRTRA